MSTDTVSLLALPDGRLGYQSDTGPVPVSVVRCFPWTWPDRYLSLRNADGDEVALIDSPDVLDGTSRTLLLHELDQTGQTFTITAIQAVGKEIELRCWEVETPGGERHFQTELDEWPRELPDGSLLIQDLFGDLYRIADPMKLDPPSRKLLLPLLG
jgi:hypothetical protein